MGAIPYACGWLFPSGGWIPAPRIDEISEEFGIRAQQHTCILALQSGLIRLHRPIEGEEAGNP